MTIIHFRAVNYNAYIKLKEFVIQRLDKLSHFYNQIIEIYVFTKVENTSDKKNKKAEIKITIPGNNVVVKKICKTFEEGISSAANSAERILKKRKEKIRIKQELLSKKNYLKLNSIVGISQIACF